MLKYNSGVSCAMLKKIDKNILKTETSIVYICQSLMILAIFELINNFFVTSLTISARDVVLNEKQQLYNDVSRHCNKLHVG